MAFGIKALKRHENTDKHAERRVHVPQLILGHDLAAVLKLVELKREHGPERLRLVTPHFLTKDVLVNAHRHFSTTLRDNQHTLEVAAKFSHARTRRREEEPLFYKEGQWHRFGGRAKPMELLPGEAYFLPARQELDLESLFSPEDWESLDDTLKAYQQVRVLETLEKKAPGDLADRDEWWMLFHDLGEMTCEDLWLSLPARQVLKASSHGRTLPPEAAAYLTSVRAQAAVSVSWEFSKEIHQGPRTLFLPQSMTHEWGHFILDLDAWDGSRQSASALILLQEEEATSELMADKIKLMKRVLERVFPGFEALAGREHIMASEDFLEWPGDKQAAEALLVSVPRLHTLGAYGAGTFDASFLARALLSV